MDFRAIDGFDVLYLSAITVAILPAEVREALLAQLSKLRAGGVQIVFDSNYRPRLWGSQAEAQEWVAGFWRVTDIGLPSVDDEIALFGDRSEEAALERLRSYGLSDGALKRGARGPVALDPDVSPGEYQPAPVVVDTTAAGDSFNGAFLAARLAGASLPDAMARGHAQASEVVGFRGAFRR